MTHCPNCAAAFDHINRSAPFSIKTGAICWAPMTDGHDHLFASQYGIEWLTPLAWARIILRFCQARP